MTIDNGKTIIGLRLNVLIASVLFIVFLYFTYFDNSLRFPVLGIEKSLWSFVFITLYIVVAFYPMVFRYRYIYFSDDGPKIVFRYYSVGIIRGKKNSIEIPKKDFRGYRKKRLMAGIVPGIVLSQQFDRSQAFYPPLPLSSLSSKERKRLYKVLDQYI